MLPAGSQSSHVGQGLVRRWMDHEAPALHPAFAPPSSLYDQRVSRTARESLDNFSYEFCQILQRYEEATRTKSPRSNFNVRGAHSWDEVMEAAKFAQAKYIADAKGAKGIIRKFFRLTGDHSSTITSWVGLLPSDQYFSIMCGGLKLILGVAARRSERREQILDAFDTLPDTILKTQWCHELFPNDLMLQDRATEVYLALLEIIEGMIASLVDKTLWAKLKDGLKGSRAERPLDEKIDRGKKLVQDLQDRVDHLQVLTLVSANATVSRMEPRVIQTEQTGMRTQHLTQIIDSRTSAIQMTIEGMGEGLDGIRTGVGQQLEETARISTQIEASTEATKSLMTVLQGILDFAEWNSKRIEQQVQNLMARSSPHIRNQLGYGRESILKLLAVPETAAGHDLTFMLRQSQSIDIQAQSKGRWLFRSPRFQNWLCSSRSDILSVEGNLEQYGMSRCSPMTLMSTVLIQGLAKQDGTQVLHFFCGAHNTDNDDLGGPLGLIKSLIVQLLAMNDFDFGFIGSRQWSEYLEKQDLLTLCNLFRGLVVQLPWLVLFCVIDGISLFEREQWQSQIEFITWKLKEVAVDPTTSVVFKLLVTSPGICRFIKDVMTAEDRIRIPRDAVGDGKLLTMPSADMALSRPRSSEGNFTLDQRENAESIFEHGCE